MWRHQFWDWLIERHEFLMRSELFWIYDAAVCYDQDVVWQSFNFDSTIYCCNPHLTFQTTSFSIRIFIAYVVSTSATRFKYYSIHIRVMTQRFKIFISPTYKLIMFVWMWLQRIWREREDEAFLFFPSNPRETLCAISVPSPECQKDWEWFLTFCNSWKCFLRSTLFLCRERFRLSFSVLSRGVT